MPDPADRHSASPPASPALPPSATLGPMITGFMVSQTIHVAARLGIADLLQDAAKSSDELARATATHAPSLHRMLRALAALGVLDEVEPGALRSLCWADRCGPASPAHCGTWR